MIIVGAGGFAKEVLSCVSDEALKDLRFFDDVSPSLTEVLERYEVLKNESAVKNYFKVYDNKFTIGIGNPALRQMLYEKFTGWGGQFVSVISDRAFISYHDVELGDGLIVMPGVNISSSVLIAEGTMIYYNTNITHDCRIGKFVEIAPGVQILGRVTIGNNVQIGAGAIILPDITVGSNAVIGAGAVVTKNVKSAETVVGVPAKPIKK